MIQKIEKINSIKGCLSLPGDKSLSHRSVMFSALAEGESRIYNCLDSADVNSTIDIFRKMGVEIKKTDDEIIVKGAGFGGLKAPTENLDAGNSGTTSRLMSGVLAMQNFESRMIGDESLSKRPMKRVIDPLSEMGAKFETNEAQTLPMKVIKKKNIKPINYKLPVSSAQVKSAVLLAGMHLDETTTVIEGKRTRNHTENLLGLEVTEIEDGREIKVSRKNYPKASVYNVPSDVSTAAFFIVLSLLLENSELELKNILLNDTRDGIVKIVKRMGADITVKNQKTENGEVTGDLIIKHSKLKNVEIEPEIVPNLIDEIPILSVLGYFAEGNFKVRNAKELRVKECDRINAVCRNFEKLGVDVTEYEDGFEISGEIKGDNFQFESFDDHRIAMAFGVLSMVINQSAEIKDFECVRISNPKFLEQVESIKV